MQTATTTQPISYTDAPAADEALRMFFRRTRRTMDADAFNAMWAGLSDGLRDAIHLAENRADGLRWADEKAGITRKFETIAEKVDAEMAAESQDED